ncbi:FtsK/SpoIIIE domain-containing protein [Kitasatospora purpeofusca]|uniref:FtsK/SpoIIIE domain-containing protein n=1 Tax=Kitasatospora purpeofusca TaxID=67352 RepID=UPI0012FF328A|nr:FtsK/SpoIIIE domain-containing protein [Kitasatospora purpeofusca]
MAAWEIIAVALLVAACVPRRSGAGSVKRLVRLMARQQRQLAPAEAPEWMPGGWTTAKKAHWLTLVPRPVKVLALLLLAASAGGGTWAWYHYQAQLLTGLTLVLALGITVWRRGRVRRMHRRLVVNPFFAAYRKIFREDLPVDAEARRWIDIPVHVMGRSDARRTLGERLPKKVAARLDSARWVEWLRRTKERLLARPMAWYDAVRAWKPVAWWLERRAAAVEDARVVLAFPPEAELSDGEQLRVLNLVNRRIPGAWEASWDHQGFKVTFKHPPRPPQKVLFSEVRDIIEALPASQVLIGLGTRNEKIVIDFDDETPHVGLSIGTGGGKSATLRNIIVQQIRKGAEKVVIIDPKLISQDCLDGIPEVEIYTEIGEQWDAVAKFAAEMERRYQIKKADKSATFPRWFLIMEEQNDFAEESYQTWTDVKEKGDPARPPVFGQVAKTLFKGRQANMNVISVYQRLTARAAGGTELRDQYGAKILARFSPQAWNSLVATTPRPKSSRHNGRAIVVIGGSERTCQMVFVGEDEARAYALNGREPLRPAAYVPIAEREAEAMSSPGDVEDIPGIYLGSVLGQSMDETGRNGADQTVTDGDVHLAPVVPLTKPVPAQAAPAVEPIVGLEAAAAFLGYEGAAGKAAFVKARQRHQKQHGPIPGEFQVGAFPAWWPKDLARWGARRPRAGVKETG